MSASGNLKVDLSAILAATLAIGTVEQDIAYNAQAVFGDGAGANQISKIYSAQRTLVASATEDLDLNGVLVDALGAVINFTKVRAIIIKAAAANVNNVLVGGAAANQFATMFGAATHTLVIRPGGFLCLAAPDATAYVVTAATGDLLKIANSAAGSSVVYDIVILGS